jgi:hypothetical protein
MNALARMGTSGATQMMAYTWGRQRVYPVCGTVLAPPSLTYDEAIETMVLEGLMTRLCVNPSP